MVEIAVNFSMEGEPVVSRTEVLQEPLYNQHPRLVEGLFRADRGGQGVRLAIRHLRFW